MATVDETLDDESEPPPLDARLAAYSSASQRCTPRSISGSHHVFSCASSSTELASTLMQGSMNVALLGHESSVMLHELFWANMYSVVLFVLPAYW